MAFQRSYSKVWWGSDNQLPFSSTSHNLGGSLTSGGFYYSLYSSQSQQQQQKQHQQPNSQFHHNFHSEHQAFAQSNQYYNNNGNSGYHSLDYNNHKGFIGNLSRIQEVDDENNISKLSWEKHDSPGSLRSQDSGFSDNDESHSTRSLGGRSSSTAATASPSAKSDISSRSSNASSPSSASHHTIETPPTVIRRVGKSQFYSPVVNVSRRISFSGTPTKANKEKEAISAASEENEGSELMSQSDNMQLVSNINSGSNDNQNHHSLSINAPRQLNFDEKTSSELPFKPKDKQQEENTKEVSISTSSNKIRRRKRLVRKATKPLTPTRKRISKENQIESDDDADIYDDDEDDLCSIGSSSKENSPKRQVPEYNNETVYLGEAPPPYNNETVVFGGPDTSHNSTLKYEENIMTPLKNKNVFTQNTSTPKAQSSGKKEKPKYSGSSSTNLFPFHEYENPLLNGHSPSLLSWLQDIRVSYDHEVLSTLQTKSIAAEAFKNLTITTSTVAKLIRQLQQRALYMQSDFERIERILSGLPSTNLHEALSSAEQLVKNVEEFTKVLERRAVFFSESRAMRKKYDDHIEQIRLLTKDIRYSLSHQQYISLISLLDDVQVLKRNLLITVRLVFEKMVRIIIQSIEQSSCDLMLRANINMITTLTNIDYEGFASLSDAFVQNEAIRALLIICLDHKLSSVRALALRALATVCCSPAAINQLATCDGIEIIRDVLQVQKREYQETKKRSDIERREAVSLLTQITAAWHGSANKVEGLKDCAERIIEGLTDLIVRSHCSQTLLLCAAALNNLSRIEVTSHYSIMSNETIAKLIETFDSKDEEDISVFHYEQIVAMLYNMSLNKKCHSHLANGIIINFITSVYQKEFYKTFDSRAENDAQRRTIKTILHILTRLVHDSSLGMELIEQKNIPEFFKMAIATGNSNNELPIPRDMSNMVLNTKTNISSKKSSSGNTTSSYEKSLWNESKTNLDGSSVNQNGQGGLGVTLSNADNVTIVKVEPETSNSFGGNHLDPLSPSSDASSSKTSIVTSGLKFNLTRHESYV